ncbi:integral membrane protein [[Clostridium] sordellii]|uniref:ABC-type transport system, multidrug-family permease n=1 Tax=Paraclostridium sordellii TaxID=1505 RepID=A0ABP1XQW2_PARSO|nr:ABC transporter permease [Paeniclostridium sordellii]CEJ73725.1 ABC-type transport system, multidrug-family permease [[Clostridium] sordellii] [Paeniclostridium sordellii]CEN69273.1 integral membrane protein [[Clostridium] sordellii] [Paeniclostridium sordellii]CEN72541.1 integral membrane protein [[Clostridium] sordellii] [Paeniclostridium sordellii]CEO24098.1 integral membrane protein [[Clostridium] sordellii] [Paeniclostridium sordellii]CEP75866.1 integral membrane protein [[Clostridium]
MISLLVAKNEFIRSLKNKKKLVLTFLLPLLSIIVAIGINNMMKPSINIGVIENQYVNKEAKLKMNVVDRVNLSRANKNTINTDMILAKYLGVVEFKKGNDFKVYCLDTNMKIEIEKAVSEVINSGNVDKTKGLLNILDEGSLSASQRGSGFIFITLIITCTMSASIMLKDKEDKILLRYLTTPNKLSGYILGNYIYNLINTIIQILVSSVFIYILKIDMGITISQFIVLGIVTAIIASSVSILFTVISNSELQASLLASSIALVMALFGGAFLPIEKMPNILKLISNISPIKWIIGLTSSMEKGIVYGNNLAVIILIIILSSVIVFISSKVGEKKLKY